jgi:hypothetical protein
MRGGALKRGILCLVIWGMGGAAPASPGAEPPKPEIGQLDSTKLLIPLPFFSKVGFQAGFVNTEYLDTGVDFGALVSKDIYRDFLEITASLHLWGATNDSLDVATAGLDGNFLYRIPVRWGMYCFGGFILGGNYLHREKTVISGGKQIVTSNTKFCVERFITGGAEIDLKGNRTLFIQLKYGVTDISKEFHVIGGLNFYSRYKKFIPWLAPPLMRD